MNHEHDDEPDAVSGSPVPEAAKSHARREPDHDGLDGADSGASDVPGREPDPASAIQQAIERDPNLREEVFARLMASGSLHMSRTEDYSGMLPHPDHWERFDPDTRERMLRMSEAGTTDESARRDRIVDSSLAEAKAKRRNAVALFVICLGLAGASIFVLRDGIGLTAAGIFTAVPVLSVVRDLIKAHD